MAYLILPTEIDADERSRAAWEEVLGRPKNPKDVTEFLWPRLIGVDGRVALAIGDDDPGAGRGEGGGEEDEVVTELDPINWPMFATAD